MSVFLILKSQDYDCHIKTWVGIETWDEVGKVKKSEFVIFLEIKMIRFFLM